MNLQRSWAINGYLANWGSGVGLTHGDVVFPLGVTDNVDEGWHFSFLEANKQKL